MPRPDVDPQTLLDLNLAELRVRGEVVSELLALASAALAECAFRATRTDDPEGIADHVSDTLAIIHGRLDALVPEEPDAG
jgi:hypothetical protein